MVNVSYVYFLRPPLVVDCETSNVVKVCFQLYLHCHIMHKATHISLLHHRKIGNEAIRITFVFNPLLHPGPHIS